MKNFFRYIQSSLYLKILFGFSLILAISLFLGYGTLNELRIVSQSIDGVTPRILNIQALGEMSATLETLRARLSSGNQLTMEDVRILLREIKQRADDIHSRAINTDDSSLSLSRMANDLLEHTQTMTQEENKDSKESLQMFMRSLEELRQAIDDEARRSQEESVGLLSVQREVLSVAMRRLLSSQVALFIFGIFLAMFLARTITSPLQILRESVAQVSRGDYGAKVAIRSKDELGELASAFNEMSLALRSYTTSLESTVMERTKELNEKVNALNALTAELDESAQMLIRRDVLLSRASERLQELDQVKSEFISVAAHQLRTPLSAIKWTLALLLDGEIGVPTPEQRELYEKAAQSNERMIRLIDDMLTVTRIESGKTVFVNAPLVLGDVLATAIEETKDDAERKGVRMSLSHIPEHRSILGDREKIQAVFQNLIENAIRYTPKGGIVTLALSQLAHAVQITIQDTGIGIPEKQKASIFTKFFRADNAVKTVTDGTGLGLYVAKTIIERHHGTLRFESIEGKGTTFFVTLPTEDAPFGTHLSFTP